MAKSNSDVDSAIKTVRKLYSKKEAHFENNVAPGNSRP